MKLTPTLLFGLLTAAPALASVQWRGDFESGDISQWTKAQMVSPDRIQVVPDPVRDGRFAAKFTVQQGDNPINASGNRNELVDTNYQPEGTELYYRWSVMFAPDFPSAKTWQVFTQWHQIEDSGSPPIQFQVIGEEIQFTVSPAETLVWKTPLTRGTWHDFILHVKFSNDPSVGFVELWHNGEKVLEQMNAETRANDYLKLGLYRNANVAPVGVVFHDGMTVGERLEDVMATPPAGQQGSPQSAAAGGAPAPAPEVPAWMGGLGGQGVATPAPAIPAWLQLLGGQ